MPNPTPITAANLTTPPVWQDRAEGILDVWTLAANPAGVTDWGALINTAVTNGAKRLFFPRMSYPFTTPIVISGGSTRVAFVGEAGRGWYTDINNAGGSILLWKGGASPVVTVTDGAMTSGSKVLTSATAPWTLAGVLHVGQPITVANAGPAGGTLTSVIASRQSSTQVTLLDAASATVSGKSVSFTNWTRAIQGQGSTATTFRDIKLLYDNTAFDGILLDLRADASATNWSSRGLLRDMMIYGDGGAKDAYALVHLSGHGEMFEAQGVGFHFARACVRGQYGINADDAHFTNCNFGSYWEGAVVNPGRYWKMTNCRGAGSGFGGLTLPLVGPFLYNDRTGLPGANITQIELDHSTFWDFGSLAISDGAITNGTTTLTSASAPFTGGKAWYWENRVVSIAGAGPGGANLDTRIEKYVSSTQVTLRDAASATVSGATAWIQDGGVLYTKAGSLENWTVYFKNLQTYLGTSREIEMLGQGTIAIDHWTMTRQVRSDIVGFGALLNLGSAADLKRVFINDIVPTSPNATVDAEIALINLDGHDLRKVENVAFSRAFETIDTLKQESLLTTPGFGSPAVAASAGQTAGITGFTEGGDMVGHVVVTTGAGGAIAGNLVDLTFFKPWRMASLLNNNNDRGTFAIHLTPLDVGAGDSSGQNAFDAGGIGVANNANPATVWSISIRNAITGAKVLRWSYRLTRT